MTKIIKYFSLMMTCSMLSVSALAVETDPTAPKKGDSGEGKDSFDMSHTDEKSKNLPKQLLVEESITLSVVPKKAGVAIADDRLTRLEAFLKAAAESGYISLKSGNTEGEVDSIGAPQTKTISDIVKKTINEDPIQTSLTEKKEGKRRSRLRPFSLRESSVREGANLCAYAGSFYFGKEDKSITYDDVFEIRQTLLDDTGGYDIKALTKLVRAYLALGLGEEAISAAKIKQDAQTQLLMQMAQLVAQEPVDDVSTLKNYSICTKRALPWYAMALASDNPEGALQQAALAIGDIYELPLPLKQLFSTQLGILAAEENQWGLAEELFKLSRASSGKEDTSVLYLKSLLNSHKGKIEAIDDMRRVSQQSGPLQAKAILSFGRLAAEENAPLDQGYFTDLAYLKTQYKGGLEGATAEVMEIRLLADTSEYTALIEKALLGFNGHTEERKNARDIIASSMQKSFSESNSVRKFSALMGYIDHQSFFSDYPQTMQLRLSAAKAALFFDLPSLVYSILEGAGGTSSEKSIKTLLAKAMIIDGKAEEALQLTRAIEGQASLPITLAAARVAPGSENISLLLEDFVQTKEVTNAKAALLWEKGQWQLAKEAYADLLIFSSTDKIRDRHALASYMSGEGGGFFLLGEKNNALFINKIIETYAEEKKLLERFLTYG